jgi:hypothetical protein
MDDSAQIEVQREDGHHVDRRRAYKVLIDGAVVGQVGVGETACYPVAAGKHEVELRVDWVGSEIRTVDLKPNGIARFVCSPRVSGPRSDVGVARLMRYTVADRHHYLDLRAVD